MEKTFDNNCYVICHNGKDIFHFNEVEAGTVMATGQPFFEEFEEEEDWKARLTELGADISSLGNLPLVNGIS